MAEWISGGHGVQYRQHPTRKHGVRPDRYFRGRYGVDGRRITVAFGWESEGWTLSKALLELGKLKAAAKVGDGPSTLKEKRALAETKRKAEEAAREKAGQEALTVSTLFEEYYMPQARRDKKSWARDDQLYHLWCKPVIGPKRLVDVSPFDLERIKKAILDKRLSPRSVQYCMAVLRHAFNFARQRALYSGENPVSKVKVPTPDNRRMRFLSREEASVILDGVKQKSPEVWRMCLLTLYCGLRFGEIASLGWSDVDRTQGTIMIRNPKNGRTRVTFMAEIVRTMFQEMEPRNGYDLVFPPRKGARKKEVSNTFQRVVDSLGLNEGIQDRRQKVVFHSLRHTFASWLVAEGVDLYTVAQLLGHRDLAMTQRYAHLAPDTLRAAVRVLDKANEKKVVHLAK